MLAQPVFLYNQVPARPAGRAGQHGSVAGVAAAPRGGGGPRGGGRPVRDAVPGPARGVGPQRGPRLRGPQPGDLEVGVARQ